MSFQYDLRRLTKKAHLLNFLELREEIFDAVLAFVPYDRQSELIAVNGVYTVSGPLFVRHDIPKKNTKRGTRLVWEPLYLKRHYKALGRRLNNFFKEAVPGFPHERSFGYIGRRNIRENAWDHCGHEFLISIDLKDFFPSIKVARITDFLVNTGMDAIVADLLSRFVTIGGTLPLGLPTSPTIANAICLPLDQRLTALARKYQATNSRYADDISFSSDTFLPTLAEITACVEAQGFEIAASKTRRSRCGQAHYVTGLSISDPKQPHAPKEKKRRLRQELYYSNKFGLFDHLHYLGIDDDQVVQREINRLDGLVKFIGYHELRHRARLKNTWDEILQGSGRRPSFEPKNQEGKPFHIHVDEAEYIRPDGMRFLALAMTMSQHQEEIDALTKDVLDSEKADPWAAGRKSVLDKQGLHFSQVSQDLQKTYVERLRPMLFEGYIAMAPLSDTHYEDTYLKLLRFMITRRLMAAESREAFFVFEKNDKVSQTAVKTVVNEAFTFLRTTNNRRPENCSVAFEGKPHFGLCVPDTLLYVLGRYLKAQAREVGDTNRDELMFERLRDRFKLIFDLSSGKDYSRRREIVPWRSSGGQ